MAAATASIRAYKQTELTQGAKTSKLKSPTSANMNAVLNMVNPTYWNVSIPTPLAVYYTIDNIIIDGALY